MPWVKISAGVLLASVLAVPALVAVMAIFPLLMANAVYCEFRDKIPLVEECPDDLPDWDGDWDGDDCAATPTPEPEPESAGRGAGAAARDSAGLELAGTTFETLDDRQLEHAQTIIDTGIDMGVPEYGLVIAIATAMQESALYMYANSSAYPDSLDYPHDKDGSDHDSLGLFQQRPAAGWGSVAELMDPVYNAKAFYGGPGGPNDGAPPGLLDIPGWQEMSVAEAAQSVQVSAFPDAYAKWETMARDTVAALADGAGSCTCPAPVPAEETADGQHGCATSDLSAVVQVATEEHRREDTQEVPCERTCDEYIGDRPAEDWCADFVSWVFREAGLPFYPTPTTEKFFWRYDWQMPAVDGFETYFRERANGSEFFTPDEKDPQPGDIAIYANHVNIVVEVDPERRTLKTIGGNEGVYNGAGAKVNDDVMLSDGTFDYGSSSGLVGYGRVNAGGAGG